MKFKQTYKELWTKTSLPASIFNIYYFLSLLMTISEKGQIRIQLNNSDAYGSRSAILRITFINEIKAQRFWIVKITGAKLNFFSSFLKMLRKSRDSTLKQGTFIYCLGGARACSASTGTSTPAPTDTTQGSSSNIRRGRHLCNPFCVLRSLRYFTNSLTYLPQSPALKKRCC